MSWKGYGYHWFTEWQSPEEYHARVIRRVIAERKSEVQHSLIVEFNRYGKSLIIDGKIQSSQLDEASYHESLVHPALISIEKRERILILGGGEGATLREVLRYRDVKEVKMIDIDKDVIELSEKYLDEWHRGSFRDPRAKILIGDGKKYIEENDEVFNAIILDLTDPHLGNPSYELYTREFYQKLTKRIEDSGIIVTQSTSPSFSPEVFSSIVKTLASVFPKVRPWVTYIASFDGLWSFTSASNSIDPYNLTKEEVNERISKLINGELEFYDGETHEYLMRIPKNLRKVLKYMGRISTLSSPVGMPA
jgi:spermidine synthase